MRNNLAWSVDFGYLSILKLQKWGFGSLGVLHSTLLSEQLQVWALERLVKLSRFICSFKTKKVAEK
jgi:hypothetical protein